MLVHKLADHFGLTHMAKSDNVVFPPGGVAQQHAPACSPDAQTLHVTLDGVQGVGPGIGRMGLILAKTSASAMCVLRICY